MYRRILSAAVLPLALGIGFLLAAPAAPGRAQDAKPQDAKPAEAAAPAPAAAAAPAPDPAPISPPTEPDSTGSSYAGAGASTAGAAATKADNKVTEVTKTQDLKLTKVGVNLVWGMVAGFLVMFMEAGFGFMETGLCRAKNCAHTMAMNFLVYAIGMLGFWICGFAFQMGGMGSILVWDGPDILHNLYAFTLFGKELKVLGHTGYFLAGAANDVSVLGMFLFQMVFMDTAATIPTGAMAERWKMSSFFLYGLFMSMIIYPVYGCWVWGGGWLSQLGVNFGLGNGHCDFAGSSVVHMTGGVCALGRARSRLQGLGSGNSTRTARPT